uniref:Uncharacterized protein n=1 Tax=viral metagenome TaxID=1070528 RepID=A0A6C0K553_9ZZZZ
MHNRWSALPTIHHFTSWLDAESSHTGAKGMGDRMTGLPGSAEFMKNNLLELLI